MLKYPSRGRLPLLALAFGLTVVVPIAIPSLALAHDGSPHQRGSGTATDAWLVGLRHVHV